MTETKTPTLDSYFEADRQRRSRLEIKIIVMQAISEGNHRLAHIMYYAKVPTRMCSSILRGMEQQGLVESVLTQQPQQHAESISKARLVKCYALTERGQRALDSYLVIMTALKPPLEIIAAANNPDAVASRQAEQAEEIPTVQEDALALTVIAQSGKISPA